MVVKRSPPIPRDAKGNSSSIDAAVARQLAIEFAQSGLEAEVLLHGLGFQVDDLGDPGFRLTYHQHAQLVRRAVRFMHLPHLGLRLGGSVNLATWGMALVGLMACADSRQWLAFATEFLPPASGVLKLHLEDNPGLLTLTARGLTEEPDVMPFLVENAFASLVVAFRATVGADCGPDLVELVHPAPTCTALHRQVFGCAVSFQAQRNRIHFPAQSLPIRSADAVTLQRARHALEQHDFLRCNADELEIRVVRAVERRLADPPTLQEVSKSLHMSERTLRRRLGELGISYAAILDRERRDRALALLQGGQHSMQAVAAHAGFADTRSLRRAVKRWSEQRPSTPSPGK